MEHLALGLVLLVGTLAAGSPPGLRRQQDLDAVRKLVLDMAPTSFDDQYRGCSHMMEEELAELNRTEFANNQVYAQAWTVAAAEWQSRSRQGRVPQTLRPELAITLLAYTGEGPLYQEFNQAVREAGRSRQHYLHDFHFKVLHFLLSEALRALRDARPHRCYKVFRGVQGIHFNAQQYQSIRFGRFTSASLRKNKVSYFGHDTVFSLETCYGVPIKDFSFYPEEEEVLIPPFEIFEVISVIRNSDGASIQLQSQAANSTYNCELVKEKRCKSRPCVFSAGRSIPSDPPHLWALLLAATALAAAAGP